MSLLEEPEPLLFLTALRRQARHFTETLIQQATASMSATTCSYDGSTAIIDACRDDSEAFRLKMVAIGAILVAGVVGVAIPLLGRKRRVLRTDGNLFVLAKAFAAGVILATGFVHMLHDAQTALTDPCLPESPWQRFPFPGFVAMVAALVTLVVDFVGTQFYEHKHREEQMALKAAAAAATAASASDAIVAVAPVVDMEAGGAGEKEVMHIIGIHAHAAAHRHNHQHERGAYDGGHVRPDEHGQGQVHDDEGHVSSHVRHVVVSQILELGIVSHSVIIGLSLGVSQSPCTIRPLIAALSFHQFFEGFALGGCISQAQFRSTAASVMACFFAITTPAGVGLGTVAARQYNANSPRALVAEGILDSVSAGILIYMALVDLIAADFLSRRMSCNFRLQVASYAALFLGAASMSSLAIWA